MAIIKLGTIVTGIRGTLGGIVFSANASGPYAKRWRMPIIGRAPKQLEQRNLLSAMPTTWRALTQTQRDAWDTWAALPGQELTNSLGDPYYISGFLWYTKINVWGVTIGFSLLSNPPTMTKPTAPTILTADVQNTPLTAKVTYAAGTFGATDSIVIFAAPWPHTSALVPPNTFRFLRGVFNPPSTSFTFQTQWQAALGDPIITNKAFVHVYIQNQQRYRSAPTLITDTIAN